MQQVANPDWITFGSRLRWARKKAKLTQTQLESRTGLSQSTISDIENGEVASSGATASLASAVKVNALWLESNRGLPYDLGITSERDLGASQSTWTPVLGEARLGDKGYYLEEPFEAGSDGWIKVDGGAEAYGLRCWGDSMRPSIKPGWYVIVAPRLPLEEGRLAVCQTRDGRRMIKILNRRRDGVIELTSTNEEFGAITVLESEVFILHRAIGPLPPELFEEAGG